MENIYDISHDNLEKDIKDPRVQEKLVAIFRDDISKGESQQQNEGMPDLWKDNAYYYEGYHNFLGFHSDHRADFAARNTFVDTKKYKLKRDDNTGKVFVIDNKIKDAIDGQIGEYTNVKKVIVVDYDDIDSNDNIEYATKKALEYIQDRKQVWEQVLTPCIAGMAKYGLFWYAVKFNPRKNLPYGDIHFEYYHPMDVLVDPQAKKKYFIDSRWVIRKIKIPYEEAYEYLKRYKPDLKKEDVKADSDYYSLGNQRHDYISSERDDYFVTLYIKEYKREEIRKSNSESRVQNAELRDKNGKSIELEEEITRYYKQAYNSSLGVIQWTEDEYANVSQGDQWQFEIIPFYNQENSLRQYPNSDIEKLAMIQDLINMSETLLLDNAKQRNLLRMIVRQEIYENYEEEFKMFVRDGGILPIAADDIKNAFMPAEWQELPQQFYQFMDMMKASFQEHGSQNAILQGAYPKSGSVSKPIIDGLENMRSRHFGYKETNINWAVTQGSKRIFRIIASEWTEENFLKVTSKSKDDPKYIPINAVLTFAEYEELLKRVYPNMEPEQASDKFMERNEVKIIFPKETELGWMINRFGRIIRNVDEVRNAESMVLINMLSLTPKDKIEITVTMDWDFEKNKKDNEIKAFELSKGGKITDDVLFENIGDYWRDNKQEIMEKKKAENEILMKVEELQQLGPEFMQMVDGMKQQYLQAMAEKKNGSSGTGSGSKSVEQPSVAALPAPGMGAGANG